MLEAAARELQQVVLHTSSTPLAMDGQIPMCIQAKRGLVGIEVKTCQAAVNVDEVQKFLRDAASNDFAVALLISTRSPITRKRRGLQLERVTTPRGVCWCLFVSPVHDMTAFVTSALSVALELAVDGRGEANLPQDVGEALQREVHALAGIKRKLKEEDLRAQSVREHTAENLVTAQNRLSALVDSILRAVPRVSESNVARCDPDETSF